MEYNVNIHDMIIGVDMVSIERFQRLLQKFDKTFLKHIFTPYELEKYGQSVQRLAARFAVKEATSKAFQVGLAHMNRNGIPATDIEVRSLANGAPILQLSGLAEKFAKENQIHSLNVSISHERKYAIAMVIGMQLKAG